MVILPGKKFTTEKKQKDQVKYSFKGLIYDTNFANK